MDFQLGRVGRYRKRPITRVPQGVEFYNFFSSFKTPSRTCSSIQTFVTNFFSDNLQLFLSFPYYWYRLQSEHVHCSTQWAQSTRRVGQGPGPQRLGVDSGPHLRGQSGSGPCHNECCLDHTDYRGGMFHTE